MLNTKTISVLKRISKEAPATRPILKNYSVKDSVLYMTDGHKMVWAPVSIKDGLYTVDGENVTETSGTYPDVIRLIPTEHETAIAVPDVKNLLEFVKAYVKLHGLKRSDNAPIIKLVVADNTSEITGDDEFKAVTMSYNLLCDNTTDSIAYYNPFYLIDVLEFISANITDNIATIKYCGSLRPPVLETTNGTGALVMPIRRH